MTILRACAIPLVCGLLVLIGLAALAGGAAVSFPKGKGR